MRFLDANQPSVRVVRAALAALVLAAVIRQVFVVYEQPDPAPIKLFSFFTIQANLIAGGVWLLGAWRPESTVRRPLLRGAAATYLSIAGVVYFVLAFDANQDEILELTAWWVNALTHQVLPLAVLIEWILLPPNRAISVKRSLMWLLYPIAFFFYSMIRGLFSGWYPYPFLIPGYWNGYSGVAVNALILLAMMLPIAVAVGRIGTLRATAQARASSLSHT